LKALKPAITVSLMANMILIKRPFDIAVMMFIALVIAACTSGGAVDYRNYEPVFEVRNAPIPVPWPRSKPGTTAINATNTQSASAATVTTGASVAVGRGDTLYRIARRAGVGLDALIAANSLRAPYRIQSGQRLRLPVAVTHTVARGETGYSISRRYGVDLTSLVRINSLSAPYRLRVGQRLRIPAGGRSARSASATPPSRAPAAQSTTPNRPSDRTRVGAPPPRQGSTFAWPLEGRILVGFGSLGDGLHSDGINIRSARGASVKAADAGVVAYAGNELRGFGNLLLIRHDGGWVTAYAHNEQLLVSRGDRVRRGQSIASVGSSGGVSEPQLHFEVRRGTTAVDPVRYLASRN
jgi:murein DD-endopeptidase MepM/ murein hydrolase activator NlpD